MGKWFETERLSRILRVCLQVTFAAGLIVTAFMSVILRRLYNWYFGRGAYYWAAVVLLTVCGLCALVILWQLIRLLKTVGNRNPFVRENVAGLRWIAVCSFIISAMFLALSFFRISALTAGTCYVFFIAGFFCVIISALFQRAVNYKEESDLTV